MKKRVLIIILSIFIVFIVIAATGVLYISHGLKAGVKLAIAPVNPSSLTDGTYKGEYSAGRWSNTVAVTIEDGKITDIKIVKDVTIPQPGLADELFGRVIVAQNTTVDAVSGATVTSKAYLKSVENALTE